VVVNVAMVEEIFVSIPAYRDPECSWTVRDLFRKAKYPSRICVGICFQLKLDSTLEDNDWETCLKLFTEVGVLLEEEQEDLKTDKSYLKDDDKAVWVFNDNKSRKVKLSLGEDDLLLDANQIRMVFVRWSDARGPCLARHLAHRLYRGEKYQLSIDSHMRFGDGWDEKLVNELQLCASQNEGSIERCIVTTYPGNYERPNKIHNVTCW
jgi:hypothetical protein